MPRRAGAVAPLPRSVWLVVLPLLLFLMLLPACDEFSYEGFQKPFRFELFQDIPMVYLGVEDGSPWAAVVDTATPLMLRDRRRDGSHEKTTTRLFEPVECLTDAHCRLPGKPRCDRSSGRCAPQKTLCSKDLDCSQLDPLLPYCDNGVCAASVVECLDNSGCKDADKPSCSSGKCVLFNPRFLFRNLEFYDLPVASVGLDTPLVPRGILGAALLQNFVVRLSFRTPPTMTLLDEIPDSDEDLADDCDHSKLIAWTPSVLRGCTAIMRTPRLGGGLLALGDEEVDLPATRLVVDVCLQPDAFDPSKADRTKKPEEQLHGAVKESGVPASAVLATGLGMTVIAKSLADRLIAKNPNLVQKTNSTLYLPYGTEAVTVLTLDRLALVSNESQSLGPCAELALRRRVLLASTVDLTRADKDLLGDKQMNGAGLAALDRTLEVAVVREDSPLLQGLRLELRGVAADVDMVLGGSVIKHLELEVDYPSDRTILRCPSETTGVTCRVVPLCAHPANSSRDTIQCPQALTE